MTRGHINALWSWTTRRKRLRSTRCWWEVSPWNGTQLRQVKREHMQEPAWWLNESQHRTYLPVRHPSHSSARHFPNLEMQALDMLPVHQAFPHLHAFAHAIFSPWNTLFISSPRELFLLQHSTQWSLLWHFPEQNWSPPWSQSLQLLCCLCVQWYWYQGHGAACWLWILQSLCLDSNLDKSLNLPTLQNSHQ